MKKRVVIKKADLFALYLEKAHKLEDAGIRPTGRKLVAMVRGGMPKDYPQGIGGNDKLAYDNAMIELGYSLDNPGHTWKKVAVGLDEVECNDHPCQYSSLGMWVWHTIGDHLKP